jgi:hypothetical protein
MWANSVIKRLSKENKSGQPSYEKEVSKVAVVVQRKSDGKMSENMRS